MSKKPERNPCTLLCEEVLGIVVPEGMEIPSEKIEELYRRYRAGGYAPYPAIWDRLIKEVFAHTPEAPFTANAITFAVTALGNRKILYIGDLVSRDAHEVKKLMGEKSWEALLWCVSRHGLQFRTDTGTWASDAMRAKLR